MNTIRNLSSMLLLFFPFQLLYAYEFSPLVQEFSATGLGTMRQFLVTNTQQNTVAIQIETLVRTTDDKGNEQRKIDYDSFIVSPPQMVIQPGQSQVVRVQWIGTPDVALEQSYRLITTQLPINFETANKDEVLMTIKMGYQYEAAIYVTPKNAKPNAELKSARLATDESGKNVLQLRLHSNGTTRAILLDPEITIKSKPTDTTVTLKEEQLAALQMKNLISGSTTVFELPWPADLPLGEIEATFETKYFEN